MFVMHDWPGAWICNLFRNEGAGLSSELILEAVSVMRYDFGEPSSLGMVTFVDPLAVRHKRDPGRCFIKAGFRRVGFTKVRKRIVLQLLPRDMPQPEMAIGQQQRIR